MLSTLVAPTVNDPVPPSVPADQVNVPANVNGAVPPRLPAEKVTVPRLMLVAPLMVTAAPLSRVAPATV